MDVTTLKNEMMNGQNLYHRIKYHYNIIIMIKYLSRIKGRIKHSVK